jgi:hypothetical protein
MTHCIKLVPLGKGKFNVIYCLGRGKSILILENVPSLKAEGLARRLENVLGCDRDAMMFRRQGTGAKKE